LRPIQNVFNPNDYPDLLVGLEDPDDAAVWQLDEKRALVVTTDFFTPVVDDPYDYGAIAAANSLSDIYAMGAQPFLALNIAALPPNLPIEISSEILRGGAEKTREANVVIAGGHTVQDKEPKYGLVALGFVDKDKMLTKTGLNPGDALVLTKPLGFGCTTTALKQDKADPADVREVVDWMKLLNRTAGLLAVEFALSAATDITGFSLLGHGLEMAVASGVALEINFEQLPFVSGAFKYAEMWTFPGGASDNRGHFSSHITFDTSISESSQMLLFDPQTSGGLLIGISQNKLEAFKKRAKELEQPVWVIGEVRKGSGIEVRI
jgi:selenide,water dikinase